MNSERNIILKLKESKELEEAGFEARGSVYKCAFGRYYKDGEEISRDEYFKAKGGESSTTTPERPTSNPGTSSTKSVDTVVPNPESPNKVNYRKVTKSAHECLQELGAEYWDGFNGVEVYEFEGRVTPLAVATKLSNLLRTKGYKTQFWTRGGSGTDEPTTYFSVRDPKDRDRMIDYHISKDTENTSKGKSYIDISIENCY